MFEFGLKINDRLISGRYRRAVLGTVAAGLLLTACDTTKVPTIDVVGCHREYTAQFNDNLYSIAGEIIRSDNGKHNDEKKAWSIALEKAREAKGMTREQATDIKSDDSVIYLPKDVDLPGSHLEHCEASQQADAP